MGFCWREGCGSISTGCRRCRSVGDCTARAVYLLRMGWGTLPAYLFVKENLRIRDNDPAFLRHVARWYEQILPILKKYEAGQGGTIIAVQLDNELDFYPCSDPKGYISGAKRFSFAAWDYRAAHCLRRTRRLV